MNLKAAKFQQTLRCKHSTLLLD